MSLKWNPWSNIVLVVVYHWCCASRYHGHGQAIISHRYCGMQLHVHALYWTLLHWDRFCRVLLSQYLRMHANGKTQSLSRKPRDWVILIKDKNPSTDFCLLSKSDKIRHNYWRQVITYMLYGYAQVTIERTHRKNTVFHICKWQIFCNIEIYNINSHQPFKMFGAQAQWKIHGT